MPPEASPDTGQRSGPTEAEFERTPETEAGRALIEQRLQRFSAEQQAAFWEAVGRCFASAAGSDD